MDFLISGFTCVVIINWILIENNLLKTNVSVFGTAAQYCLHHHSLPKFAPHFSLDMNKTDSFSLAPIANISC